MSELHEIGIGDVPMLVMDERPSVPHDMLTQSLTDKIAMMLIYCEDLRTRIRPRDNDAFNSLLDDPEVARWLTIMRNAGRGRNTRFTG